jgi:hypothetical protein
LRALSLIAILAAVGGFVMRRPIELRLIAITPLVFMAMMIAVHPPTLTPRYLFSIIPVACFVGGMLLHDIGLSTSRWKGLWSARTALVLAFLVVLFGAGFLETRGALLRHTAFQRGELTLYPWRVFEEQIEIERPKEILVGPRLFRKYQMIGKKKTRERIARMYFRRRHLRLLERVDLQPEITLAVGDRGDYRRWQADRPEVKDRVTFDQSGQIVMVRPD